MKPIVIGAGLAGLTAALSLAPQPVTVLSSRQLGNATSSAWAQGGIAAAVGTGDTPLQHASDTLKAGAGLCNAEIVRVVTEDGPRVIDWLIARGVQFDRDSRGAWRLGLEGGHGQRRILHAHGDSTGLAIMQALIEAVKGVPSVEILEDTRATGLVIKDQAISGVIVERGGASETLVTDKVILATGGAGALWQQTTNPLGSWGRGLILAARAGAVLADLEFMQFHPTAIDVGRDPMPLASEALRGEGAILIDETGVRFMEGQGRAELEPRDIVARAIWNHMQNGHQVFLDARQAIGARFAEAFPFIFRLCQEAGLDPTRQPIPIRPAAHYHMGGIEVDPRGRSSVSGLWACGEVASSGLHGANRLASNSLLEAVSSGLRVARDISGLETSKVLSAPSSGRVQPSHDEAARDIVRAQMSRHVGVLRDGAGLARAIDCLAPLAESSDMALIALLIATSALRREESRGAQARTDFPRSSAAFLRPTRLTLADLDLSLKPPLQRAEV